MRSEPTTTSGRLRAAEAAAGEGDAPAAAVRIRFDRHELAGAFGDLGTDLPLLVGMALAAGLHGTSVLVVFGAMQILTGLAYRMPMPVQPLKAVAALVIAQHTPAPVLYGAGLAIGLAMLVLAASGLLDWLGRVVPKSVVRGIQLGLGLQLAGIALGRYVGSDGAGGYAVAGAAFLLVVALLGSRRLPAGLPVVALGALYALLFRLDPAAVLGGFGLHLPAFRAPRPEDVLAGFLLLALPQIPLSLGNSLLATRQLAADLFPGRAPTLRKLGLTYAAMNLVSPWLGGVPTCHGSGGMAGHYAFGGRTGGSVILYGAVLAGIGLFFGPVFDQVIRVFPLPVLGVLLLFEALALLWAARDVAGSRADFPIATLVGLVAVSLPYGYLVGLVLGTALARLGRRVRLVAPDVP